MELPTTRTGAMTRIGAPLAIPLAMSDEDVQRLAAAVAAQVLAIVPKWLPDRPLSRSETADWLRVSTVTLHRWEESGVLVPTRVGDIVRYTPAQLAEFFATAGRGEKARRQVAESEVQ